jgi:hypothetical protein
MTKHEGEIIVAILGQWASGKSAAAETLVRYLGGEGEVVFITDRKLLAGQAVKHILELEDSEVKRSLEDDGKRKLEGKLTSVWLDPGEDLETVDLNTLLFDLHDDVYDNVPPGARNWLEVARMELGHLIRDRSTEGKPVVIEVGFGTNMEPRGENPIRHTISDLFLRLEEAGVEPMDVRWIIIEASYENRAERNRRRKDTVSAHEFERFAADGGDLAQDQEKKWASRGTIIKRVPNDHDDLDRFRADIIAAYDELF